MLITNISKFRDIKNALLKKKLKLLLFIFNNVTFLILDKLLNS